MAKKYFSIFARHYVNDVILKNALVRRNIMFRVLCLYHNSIKTLSFCKGFLPVKFYGFPIFDHNFKANIEHP